MRSNPQNNQNPYAVVIGLDSLQGLQTARILARRQIPVIALAKDPTHYGCQTNVCQKIIFTNTDGEELIRALATLGPTLGAKAVLFPCEDANVLLVSQHRQRLARWYHIVLSAPEVVEQLIDKANFYAYAQENGFPIPRTFLIQSRVEAEAISQRVTFPCILKPPISAAPEWENNTLQKAFKVADVAQLLSIYDHFKQWSNAFIVQEWIEGPETNHYTCNCYFDQAGEPVVTFVTRKIRQWPPRTGQACLGVECRNDVVLNETLRLFRSVNYRGLGYVELKKDERTGQYFFIEPNIGRPTGARRPLKLAGWNCSIACTAMPWVGRCPPIGSRSIRASSGSICAKICRLRSLSGDRATLR